MTPHEGSIEARLDELILLVERTPMPGLEAIKAAIEVEGRRAITALADREKEIARLNRDLATLLREGPHDV